MIDGKGSPRDNVSTHILPTAGTMLGICTTLVGLVKLHEHHAGSSRVDEHGGVVAIFFLASALGSYVSIRTGRRPRVSAALERFADACFIIGLLGLAGVSVLFAYEVPLSGRPHLLPANGVSAHTSMLTGGAEHPISATLDPHPPRAGRAALGDSLTVEQWTLTPLVEVRILVPQPLRRFPDTPCSASAIVLSRHA